MGNWVRMGIGAADFGVIVLPRTRTAPYAGWRGRSSGVRRRGQHNKQRKGDSRGRRGNQQETLKDKRKKDTDETKNGVLGGDS